MTNLAYRQTAQKNNLAYVDFAAHAAYTRALQRRRALGLQHRYGVCLLALCALAAVAGLCSATTDLTALLVLAPLGVYLLCTRQVILYCPHTIGARRPATARHTEPVFANAAYRL